MVEVLSGILEGVVTAPWEKDVSLLVDIGEALDVVDQFYTFLLGVESRQSGIRLEEVIASVVVSLVILEPLWPAIAIPKSAYQNLFLMAEVRHGRFPKEIEALVLGSLSHFIMAELADEKSLKAHISIESSISCRMSS